MKTFKLIKTERKHLFIIWDLGLFWLFFVSVPSAFALFYEFWGKAGGVASAKKI
jgi:hypothetical protein